MSTEPRNRDIFGELMNRIASILTGLSLAVLLFVCPAHAARRMTANIPFAFTVGTVSLPAGQYEFVRAGDDVVEVRDAGGRSLFTMASAPIQGNGTSEKSTLKFATVDGRHVLIQIWSERSSSGYEFSYKHAERIIQAQTIGGTLASRR
jgi:hypothetical protein